MGKSMVSCRFSRKPIHWQRVMMVYNVNQPCLLSHCTRPGNVGEVIWLNPRRTTLWCGLWRGSWAFTLRRSSNSCASPTRTGSRPGKPTKSYGKWMKMAIDSGFTWIYPFKIVIFHSYVNVETRGYDGMMEPLWKNEFHNDERYWFDPFTMLV